jgi:hypothetical protein
MATRRTTFEKLQRERAKKAKAAAKRERRQEKGTDADPEAGDDTLDDSVSSPPVHQLSEAELLERIEAAHERLKAGMISYEEFEEQKAELLEGLAAL